MEQTNEAAITYLNNNVGLIDAFLKSIFIYEKNNLIHLDITIKKDKDLYLLSFIDVKEYSIYYSMEYIFSTIESYFLNYNKTDSTFYLTLDPYEESGSRNIKDQDFVLSTSLKVTLLEQNL